MSSVIFNKMPAPLISLQSNCTPTAHHLARRCPTDRPALLTQEKDGVKQLSAVASQGAGRFVGSANPQAMRQYPPRSKDVPTNDIDVTPRT